MVRTILNTLLIFLLIAGTSWAKMTEAQLKQIYGQDLSHAPFFLRFSFYKSHNKDWYKSLYFERHDFLMYYEENKAKQEALDKAEAKLEAEKEKEHNDEKAAKEKKEKDRIKREHDEEAAEEKEYNDRQKQFDQQVSSEQQEVQQMLQQSKQQQQ